MLQLWKKWPFRQRLQKQVGEGKWCLYFVYLGDNQEADQAAETEEVEVQDMITETETEEDQEVDQVQGTTEEVKEVTVTGREDPDLTLGKSDQPAEAQTEITEARAEVIRIIRSRSAEAPLLREM